MGIAVDQGELHEPVRIRERTPVAVVVQGMGIQEIDHLVAQLPERAPADLGEPHLEEDLVGCRRLEVVDHLRAGALRQLAGPTRHHRRAHLSGEDQRVAGGRDLDVLIRVQLPEVPAETRGIRRDLHHVDAAGPGSIPDHEGRRPHGLAVDEQLSRGHHDGLRHLGIGHGDPADRPGLTSTAEVPRASVTDPCGVVMNCWADAGAPAKVTTPRRSVTSQR